MLDFEEHPLIAELVGEPIYRLEKPKEENVSVRVRIRNASHEELRIARIPCSVSTDWSGGSSSLGIRSDEVPSRPQDFVQIAPDGSHEIQVATQTIRLTKVLAKEKSSPLLSTTPAFGAAISSP